MSAHRRGPNLSRNCRFPYPQTEPHPVRMRFLPRSASHRFAFTNPLPSDPMRTEQADTATADRWETRLPFYYGWLVVGGLIVIGAVNSSFYWLPPLFVLPMQEELGWSRTSMFAAITIRGLIGAFVSPFFGHMLDRRGG